MYVWPNGLHSVTRATDGEFCSHFSRSLFSTLMFLVYVLVFLSTFIIRVLCSYMCDSLRVVFIAVNHTATTFTPLLLIDELPAT